MKKVFMTLGIIAAVLVLLIYLYKLLNYEEYLNKEDGNIKITYYTIIWPPHIGGHHRLYYKNKLICSSLFDPNEYLLSPDSNSILYIKFETAGPNKYEFYNIDKDSKITFPNEEYRPRLAGFDGKVEWLDNRVALTNTKGTQKDILDLKNGTMEIVMLKK